MISTNQFKNGSHIEIDGTIFKILEFQHVKPGKGGAFVRTKLRKIDDGSVQDKTFRAGEKFRPVRTESRKMQYLYDSGDAAVFMDSRDYEQIEIPRDVVGDAMRWVLPNDEVDVLFVDERPSDVQVPSAVDMKVTDDRARGQGRHRLGRRHQAGDARVRASSSRCRSSSRRARSSGSTPAAASTSRARKLVHAPLRPAPRRRLRLLSARRHRSPAGGADRRRRGRSPASWPRGSTHDREELDDEIAAHARGWAVDRIAPLDRNVMRVALYEIEHTDESRPRSRSTRRSSSPRSTAAPTRPGSSTASSARSCASGSGVK